jgi:small subunit ribosomal protein S16
MVRLRLRRIGAKKQPSYRVVAADKEAPRDGRFLEALGNYNPRTEPATIILQEDRIFHWLSVGAQPSEAVERLFKQMGTDERYERFKAGEDIEKLLAEYAEVEAARNVDPRTRRDDLVGTKKKVEKVAEVEKPVKAEKAEKAEEPEEAEDVDAAEEETEEAEEVEEPEMTEETEEAEIDEEAEEEEAEEVEVSEEETEEGEEAEEAQEAEEAEEEA